MFTGLIEEIGEIASIKHLDGALSLTIKANKVLSDIKIGDSIAINGACHTVTEFTSSDFSVFTSSETLKVTNFNTLKNGSKVNLEKTLRLSDRLDGHLVSGHVDSVAKILSIKNIGDTVFMAFEVDKCVTNQMIKKGSVTIDGISLTVTEVSENSFEVSLIPHTVKMTNLQYKNVGDTVNIETDLIGKYVEKYLLPKHNNSNIDINLLERNGFL